MAQQLELHVDGGERAQLLEEVVGAKGQQPTVDEGYLPGDDIGRVATAHDRGSRRVVQEGVEGLDAVAEAVEDEICESRAQQRP